MASILRHRSASFCEVFVVDLTPNLGDELLLSRLYENESPVKG